MEIRQLEYFRAIVDAGTISGAARELHMTQPPLSYQMKMLEEELQVPLFIRGMKHITLTEAGKTLYEQAGKILMLSEVTKREVIKSSQAATIHIGMTPSTVSMMSHYLMRFAKSHPNIHFDIHEGSTFTMRDQLENSGGGTPSRHGSSGVPSFKRTHIASAAGALGTAPDPVPPVSEIYRLEV